MDENLISILNLQTLMVHKLEKSSNGSITTDHCLSATFEFEDAQKAENSFKAAYHLPDADLVNCQEFIYSRLGNPTVNAFENKFKLLDGAEDCAVFGNGMGAISTIFLSFLKPGDLLLCGANTYGGTNHLINFFLKESFGITCLNFFSSQSKKDIIQMIEDSGKADRLAMIYLETPGNPTNDLFDIGMCKEIALSYGNEEKHPLVVVDNTYMGIFQKPLELGADLVLYSATKFIGGHSDLTAGVCCGSEKLIGSIKCLRPFLGGIPDPFVALLLIRSLKTLFIRMKEQAKNAKIIATYLASNPNVASVSYLGFLKKGSREYRIFRKQCKSAGSMISFEVKGDKARTFEVYNRFKVITKAVSLGSVGTLIQHPSSQTHADVDSTFKLTIGITDSTLRLSVGIEDVSDIIADLKQALA
jgi:methionine-gamma-lyase